MFRTPDEGSGFMKFPNKLAPAVFAVVLAIGGGIAASGPAQSASCTASPSYGWERGPANPTKKGLSHSLRVRALKCGSPLAGATFTFRDATAGNSATWTTGAGGIVDTAGGSFKAQAPVGWHTMTATHVSPLGFSVVN